MSVISQEKYRDLAVLYANARAQILGSKDYLFDAVYEIVLLQAVQPEYDLLPVAYDTYTVNTDLLRGTSNLLQFVRSLNNHVLNNSNYATIDAYLAATSTTVPQEWADLCAIAGFTISPANIG